MDSTLYSLYGYSCILVISMKVYPKSDMLAKNIMSFVQFNFSKIQNKLFLLNFEQKYFSFSHQALQVLECVPKWDKTHQPN